MAKDPAFLFYYQDFAYGTRKMTWEEKGVYIELLCEQADIGHLSINDIQRVLKNSMHIWNSICYKFAQDDNGCFYNEILETHINKRKKYTESRRNNLKTPHMNSHMKPHMKPHMENVNENRNENEDRTRTGNKKFIKPTLEEIALHIKEKGYCTDAETFFAYYETNGWRTKNGPVKNWQQCLVTWEKRNKPKELQQVFGKQAVDSMSSFKRFNEKMARKTSQLVQIEGGEVINVES